MKTSQRGIDFIKSFEGVELKAYVCSAGKKTIGVGHVIRPTEVIPDEITEEEANALLAKDLERFEAAVLEAVDADMSQNQFDAFVSLAFNIGASAFAGSTLVRLFNAGANPVEVSKQFLRWDKANGKPLAGLTRRRKAESEMFLGEA